MSTLAETVELEAAIAEAELTEEETERLRELLGEAGSVAEAVAQVVAERDAEQPPPAPPAEPELTTGEPTEKQLRDLDRETTRHVEKVRTIMGPFVAGFAECEKCSGYGIVPPGPEPRDNPMFKACETCNGFGEVFTGSLREGHTSRNCPACAGRGYLEALDSTGRPLAEGGAAAALPVIPTPPPAPQLEPMEVSQGGTETRFGVPAWMGDPNLGA